ncbi:MAG: TfoX/Sxy family protein [Roseiarcus sp.]|jgi:DNA transformation protein
MDAEGLKELFAPFGSVVVKRMFGGKGVYAEEMMFAMEMDGEVYLKSDAETETLFAQAGSTPFIYQGHTRPVKVNFWRLAASAYDDADELKRWSELAMEAARRAARAKVGKVNPGKAKRPTGRAKTARKN